MPAGRSTQIARIPRARDPSRRRGAWVALAVGVAAIVIVSTLLWVGPVVWFSRFTVSPTVAYSGDINVTLSATLVGLSGPLSGVRVNFVTYPVPGTPPVVVRSAVTGPAGVATAHFQPEAPVTLRLFAQFRIPGTSETITSAPAVLQVYLPPTV
jgi:hypothetical protein